MIKKYYLRSFFILFILSCSQIGLAQITKPHFEIKNAKDQKESTAFYNAVKDVNFEEYRFYSERRVIRFVNSPVTIELFSAKELLDMYQRPVHELNILNNKAKKEIEFQYFPQSGSAKAIIKN
jgi:hypothetical protein